MSANVYTAEEAEIINNYYTPDDNVKIIRYMNFGKFMNILAFQKLYFTNVNEFEDKYEGRMPEGFFKHWNDSSIKIYKEIMRAKDNSCNAYASCWNALNDTESYALWRIYTEPDSGVAIKTSVKKLKNALNNDDIKIYKVKYINSFDDRDEDVEIPFYFSDDSFTRVKQVCKMSAYRYENEIRAILFSGKQENGKNINIDVNELIEEIYVSPYASQWFYDLVKKTVKIKEFRLSEKPIIKSKILV